MFGLSSPSPKSTSLLSHRGTDASHNFPYNCFSTVCSDIATLKSAFPLSSDTQVEVCYSHLMSAHHRRKFNLTSTELIVSIDKSMVTPAQAAKNLVRLQLLCESHMAATARSLQVCARQHTWNQILPSSPGTVPLMAVKSPFLSASLAVSIFSCSNFSPSLASHGTPFSFCVPCSCNFQC